MIHTVSFSHAPLLIILLAFVMLLNYELLIFSPFSFPLFQQRQLSNTVVGRDADATWTARSSLLVQAKLQVVPTTERVSLMRKHMLEKQIKKWAPNIPPETLQSLLSLPPSPSEVEGELMDAQLQQRFEQTLSSAALDEFSIPQHVATAAPAHSSNDTTVAVSASQSSYDTNYLFEDRDYARLALECYCQNKPRVIQFNDTDRPPCLNEWIFVTQVDFSKFLYDVAVKIYVNHCKKELVVAFRGSQAVSDWLKNLEATKVSCPWSTPDFQCGHIHQGFWSYYNVVRLTLFAKLAAHISPLSPYYYVKHITVVGHSLGGAMATLHAFELMNAMRLNLFVFFSRVKTIDVRTFGSPRVGDPIFATVFDQMLQTSRRYVNHLGETSDVDIVTTLPPDWIGFKHVNTSIALPCSLNSSLKCHSITYAYLPQFDPHADATLESFLKVSKNYC